MPFVFLIIGVLFLIVAVRGTQGDLYALLKSEFVGKDSFLVWGSSLLILGALGYVPVIQKPARAMALLVILVLILKDKGGFFTKFNDALRNPVSSSNKPADGQVGSNSGVIGGATPSNPNGTGYASNDLLPAWLNPANIGSNLAAGFNLSGLPFGFTSKGLQGQADTNVASGAAGL